MYETGRHIFLVSFQYLPYLRVYFQVRIKSLIVYFNFDLYWFNFFVFLFVNKHISFEGMSFYVAIYHSCLLPYHESHWHRKGLNGS